MTIGIDASRMQHETSTGVETYSASLIPRLAALAHESGDRCILYAPKKIHADHADIRVIPFPRLWTQIRLSLEMYKNPPDVLFIPSHTLPIIHPKRSAVTIHDVAFRRFKKAYSFAQYHYLDWSTRYAVQQAAKIIVPSETVKNDLREIYHCPEEKISVIYHGFEPPKIASELSVAEKHFACFGIHPVTPFFLFIGRLEAKKNLVRLLHAFSRFSEKYSDYRLVLAGKRGIDFLEILKTVRELNLLEKTVMPGYVTEDEKAWLYSHCRAVTFVSLAEGFGLPLLEAFHYQKPVLASDISALREVADGAAEFIDPKNVAAIAEGLDRITTDENLRNELTQKGKTRVKNFSWEQCARQTYLTLSSI